MPRYTVEINIDTATCIDTHTLTSCTWQIHRFNDTHDFDPSRSTISDPAALATAARQMGDYLFHHYHNIMF